MPDITVTAPADAYVIDDDTCDNQCRHFTFNDEERAMCSLFDVGLGVANPHEEGASTFARCFDCRDGEQ